MINKRTIIILAVVLALLVGAVYAVGKLQSKSNVVGLDDDEKSVVMFKADSDDVTEITVNMPDESYTIVKNSDGEWHLKGKESIVIDNVKAESLAVEVSVINAYQLIEKDAKDLSVYGLENPQYSFSAVIAGNTKTFYRGDETPVGSYYYFMDADNTDVYSQYSSKCASIFKSISTYRDSSITAFDSEAVNYIEVKGNGGGYTAQKSTEESNLENTDTSYSSWSLTSPVNVPVDEDKLRTDVLEKAANISSLEFVSDGGNYSDYGLDNPQYTLTIRETEGTQQTVLFGNTDENGNYYAAASGKKTVYLVGADGLSFLTLDSFYLAQKFIGLVNISDTSSVTVESKSSKYELTTYKGKKETFILNGKKLDEDTFRSEVYTSIIELTADGFCSDAKYSEPDVRISYKLREKGNKNIEFVSYDSKYYAVFTDGKCIFKIKKSSVSDMLGKLEKYSK